MNKKGEIGGFQYEILLCEEMDYISEYDVHFFIQSKTLQFTFQSIEEQASNRFSFLLTEEQCLNFNAVALSTIVYQVIEQHFNSMPYSKSRILDELDHVGKYSIKYSSSSLDSYIDDYDYLIDSYEFNVEKNKSTIYLLVNLNDKFVRVVYDDVSNNFKFVDYLLNGVTVNLENKDLYIKKINAKLSALLSNKL